MDGDERHRSGDETGVSPGGVRLRYWAAAKAAAGVAEESVAGATVAEVIAAAKAAHHDNPRFAQVVDVCSLLLDEHPLGTQDLHDVGVAPGQVLDVLPPFAGGASS